MNIVDYFRIFLDYFRLVKVLVVLLFDTFFFFFLRFDQNIYYTYLGQNVYFNNLFSRKWKLKKKSQTF